MQGNDSAAVGPSPPEAARTKLVIVEDDPTSQDILALMTARLGHQVVGRADTVAGALALAKRLAPDLVLVDISLRDGADGIALGAAIQGDLSIPVVLVTGHTEEAVLAKAAAADPYGLVFKPVQINQLHVAIQSALRRKAEESARLAESQFKTIFEQAAVGIAFLSFGGDYLRVNQRLCDLLGYSQEELLARNWHDITHPEDIAASEAQLAALYARQAPFIVQEKRYVHKSGRALWVKVTVSMTEASGKGSGYKISVVEDITERKLAQDRLAASEELLRRILAGIKAGIVVVDVAGHTILDVNDVAESILGMSRRELAGQPCSAVRWRFADGKPLPGGCPLDGDTPENAEYRVERPDGRTVPIVLTAIPGTRDGKPVLHEILFDFTARKNLERQLSIAQRLESIGGLASGIAHEINTPIQYIGDNLSFLKNSFAELLRAVPGGGAPACEPAPEAEDLDFLRAEVPKAIDQSLEGVSRVAGIVRAMKRFSHGAGEEKARLDVHKAIETTVEIARNEWKYHAQVDLDLDESARFFTCLPGDFNQVLLNLLVNAAHAVNEKYAGREDKGTIGVRAGVEDAHLVIRVSDTGCGIPEKNLHRLFDPFFTTKPVGKGTGQGLAIAHDIVVNKHGGSIDVRSEPGRGTTFTLRLPADCQAEESLEGDP